ncbi:MAG: M10 family metallopeptidase C-terminal domain-containing protein [Pseudomonadota bacterium]
MALLNALDATQALDMGNPDQWAFKMPDPGAAQNETQFSWLTEAGTDVQAYGLGFDLFNDKPATGLVQNLEFDFGNDDFYMPDVSISGVSFAFSRVVSDPEGMLALALAGNDTINGSSLDDRLYGFDRNDLMFGAGGNDTLYGGEGDDTLHGNQGKNSLYGGAGDDHLHESGDDNLSGGFGNDWAYATDDVIGDDYYNGGLGIDWISFEDSSADIHTISLRDRKVYRDADKTEFETILGFEHVIGSDDDEVFHGTEDGESILGMGGNDVINGHGGDDVIFGGKGNERAFGGAGDDRFVFFTSDISEGSNPYEYVNGGEGHDRIELVADQGGHVFNWRYVNTNIRDVEMLDFADTPGNVDVILQLNAKPFGGIDPEAWLVDGNDNAGATEILSIHDATASKIDLSGLTFANWGEQDELVEIIGGDVDQTLIGTSEADEIRGEGGNDILIGRKGADVLFAGEGDDVLQGGEGADFLGGGAGLDMASYSDATKRVVADLAGKVAGENDAAGDVYLDIEYLHGGIKNDVLRGDAADNLIFGSQGADRLYGRAGDDGLSGGEGGDVLYGNGGQDRMTGGQGADQFVYFNLADSKMGVSRRDVITDFESGQDRIEISRLDADATKGGNQAFAFIGTDQFSGTAGELRYFKSAGMDATILQADRNGDGVQDWQIELSGRIDLEATDFVL